MCTVVVTVEIVFLAGRTFFFFQIQMYFFVPSPVSFFVFGSLCDEHCSDSEIGVKISLAPSAYLNREDWMKNTKECIVLMGAFH